MIEIVKIETKNCNESVVRRYHVWHAMDSSGFNTACALHISWFEGWPRIWAVKAWRGEFLLRKCSSFGCKRAFKKIEKEKCEK